MKESRLTELSIELLGQVRISRQGTPVRGLEPPRLRALVARLVLMPGVAVDRAELAFQFWPDSSDGQARTNLRKLLHQLLQRLPRAELFLQTDAQSLLWRPDAPCHVDVHEFYRCAERDAPLHRWKHALNLYLGPLLPGFYDDWVLTERERLEALYLDVLDRLASYYEDRAEFARASGLIERRLQETPYDDLSWERLIRLRAAAGNRAGAIAAYKHCRRVFSEELGAEPSRAVELLYEQIRRAPSEPGAPHGAHTKTAGRGPNDSRTVLLPLVGREQAQAVLRRWCYQSLHQKRPALILITGEAGIGKTRLAEDLAGWASAQGVAVAASCAYEPDQAMAFTPVRRLLRTDVLRTAAGELPPAVKRQLVHLLPGVRDEDVAAAAELSAPDATSKPTWPHSPRDDWRHRELFEALSRMLAAASQPLLLILDDLQWWDGTSIAWLHYLLSHPDAVPVTVLATVRPEEDTATGFSAFVASLQYRDRLRQLELGPLTAEATSRLIEEMTDRQHAAVLAERAYAETEGNPLFVMEWMQAQTGGSYRGAEMSEHYVDAVSRLPGRIHGIIMSRLLTLSLPARRVAEGGAVLGRDFAWQLIRSVVEMDDETLVLALDELCRRRVLRERDDDVYDFAHGRIRDVLLTRLSAARRRFLHDRAAKALAAAEDAGYA